MVKVKKFLVVADKKRRMSLRQGRAQKFEKGEGAHFKAKPAGPDIVMSKKKGHHARRCPIFRPKRSEEQKKGHHARKLSFI